MNQRQSQNQRQSRRSRTNEVLTISILTALFLLAGLALLFWVVQGGALASPTPTPSATPRQQLTPTADFRATNTAQDMLTQIAFSAELATAVAERLQTGTPPPDAVGILLPGENSVMLPVISQVDAALATAIAQSIEATLNPIAPDDAPLPGEMLPAPDSPLETPNFEATSVQATLEALATAQVIQLPIVDQGAAPTDTPVAPNVELPTLEPTATETFTPTPSFTPEPTATFTPEPTPTPTQPFSLPSLAANVVGSGPAAAYVGPSSLYTQTATLPLSTGITLLNRNASGEWIYFCCVPNTNNPAWMLSASARPSGNPALAAPRENLNPNDARWLAQRDADPSLAPIPASLPAPPTDFPMARVDKHNTGSVTTVPSLPYIYGWGLGGNAGVAGNGFISGAVVSGANVVAASADGHIYSFDRDSGSQRWRFQIGENIRAVPLAEGSTFFVLSESGRLTALDDLGGSANPRYQRGFDMSPHGGIIGAGARLLFTGRQPDAERLWIVDRTNGNPLYTVALGASTAQMPAVGEQLVFVVSDAVRAINLFNGQVVWETLNDVTFNAPPLYVSPGQNTLAELYVADSQGRITALNANTGETLWQSFNNGNVTSLAANDTMLFAAGPGFVRGLVQQRRNDGQLVWQASIPGNVPGGVIVDGTRVLVVAEGGNIQLFDAGSGAIGVSDIQLGALGGSAAVSGAWIYVPTQSGILYGLRAANQ